MIALRSLVLLGIFVVAVYSHSYMTRPCNRNGCGAFWGCRWGGYEGEVDYCHGPCESLYYKGQHHTQAQRGEKVRVQWPRNNHPGGFMRLAFTVPTEGKNETHKQFDDYVHLYTCHEVNCHADAGIGELGGDTRGGYLDGNCYIDTFYPTWLADGVWTMQWTWYGGFGGDRVLGDYYSCANINITGGVALTGRSRPKFIGGDSVNNDRTDVCATWATDRLHFCEKEFCTEYCNSTNSPLRTIPGWAQANNWNGGTCLWPPANTSAFIEDGVITATEGDNEYNPYATSASFPPPGEANTASRVSAAIAVVLAAVCALF